MFNCLVSRPTYKHVVHAVVPSFSERRELCVVINSFVSAELLGIAVQHYLVTVHRLVKSFNQTLNKNLLTNNHHHNHRLYIC